MFHNRNGTVPRAQMTGSHSRERKIRAQIIGADARRSCALILADRDKRETKAEWGMSRGFSRNFHASHLCYYMYWGGCIRGSGSLSASTSVYRESCGGNGGKNALDTEGWCFLTAKEPCVLRVARHVQSLPMVTGQDAGVAESSPFASGLSARRWISRLAPKTTRFMIG